MLSILICPVWLTVVVDVAALMNLGQCELGNKTNSSVAVSYFAYFGHFFGFLLSWIAVMNIEPFVGIV
jgi:hypothetical protein